MINVQDAALAYHGVVVELLLQPLPELQRPFVEGFIAGQEIIGADDRRVAAGAAETDPPFFEDRDIPYLVVLCEIKGGSQAMATSTNNDNVV
jgi:hypothetical protein